MKLRALLATAFAFVSSPVYSQVVRYEPGVDLRGQLLELANNPPVPETVLQGETKDPKKKAFLNYYLKNILPKLEEQFRIGIRYRSYYILIDAYLQNSPEEREQWVTVERPKAMQEDNAYSVDPEWTRAIKTWGELAEGLTGSLPEKARIMAKERDLQEFPPSMTEKLNEADQLYFDFMTAINMSPSAKGISEFRRRQGEIPKDFKDGKISFAEARQMYKELYANAGLHHTGFEAVQATKGSLNRHALLRSELAQSKGFKTWAAYQLEVSGQGYTPQYRGTDNQRKFLVDYIQGLRPIRDAMIDRRLQELNLPYARKDLTHLDGRLLQYPDRSQLTSYFPANELVNIWEETLLESGFDKKVLNQIQLDILPREGKNPNAAYQMGFFGPTTEQTIIDVETLSEIYPHKSSPLYKPGFTYILQNHGGKGLQDLEVLFHEGGHATERITKNKTTMAPEGYGYAEVPSMTSERFSRDPLLLWHKAIAVDGKRPSKEEIEKFVNNEEMNTIFDLLGMAETALYDIELWDYDYSAPDAKPYLERVKEVSDYVTQVSGGLPLMAAGVVPLHYFYVSTGHFVSGEVRNIGYTYAEIASQMTANYLTDEIEKLSGRRTWWRQPLLGPMIVERVFEQGWTKPFPENIEAITGRTFSPASVIKEQRKIHGLECEDKLTGSGN